MRTIRASLLARLGSVATVAAIATTGALATAGPASAATHPRMATTLTVRARYIAHAHHHAGLIVGVLRSHRHGLAGETIYLESRTAGKKWAVVTSKVTGPRGGAWFVVIPTVRTQYVLVFKGDAKFRPSRSVVITLRRVRRA